MTVAAGKLKQVTLVLTERCNQRCSYCYVPTEAGRTMAPEVVRRSVDLLFDHAPRVGTIRDDVLRPSAQCPDSAPSPSRSATDGERALAAQRITLRGRARRSRL
ncbi:MAG: hypothetical protein HY906_22285, partial [Deltaproteobacteria bacterium]|nr:hypothetical protein [Deltaproteobacteria bacterium]